MRAAHGMVYECTSTFPKHLSYLVLGGDVFHQSLARFVKCPLVSLVVHHQYTLHLGCEIQDIGTV